MCTTYATEWLAGSMVPVRGCAVCGLRLDMFTDVYNLCDLCWSRLCSMDVSSDSNRTPYTWLAHGHSDSPSSLSGKILWRLPYRPTPIRRKIAIWVPTVEGLKSKTTDCKRSIFCSDDKFIYPKFQFPRLANAAHYLILFVNISSALILHS